MSNRPYKLLPLPEPSKFDPSPAYFYDNFASTFIEDMLRMTEAGLTIDYREVEKLRTTVERVLKIVTKKLNRNPYIKQYQEARAIELQQKHRKKATASIRKLSYYLQEFNPKDITHRTWVVNTYLKQLGKEEKDKWTMKELKNAQVFINSPFLQSILDKVDIRSYEFISLGMRALAEYKLELWNRPRYSNAESAVTVPEFNPASAVQKQELFELLGVEPLSVSKKTGNASWGRTQVEELQRMTTDKDLLSILSAFVDYSYGGIIKSNFLKAFDSFTIDGVLHGNIKLFGAKSFRNTSNDPNLLNMPSTGSVYAKPLKRCLTASKGRVVFTADLAALEDRVIANLSKDKNKLSVFTEGLDGHSLAATYYFKEGVSNLVGVFTDHKDASKKLKSLVDEEHSEAQDIRQDGKPISFGLAYGAFPPKVAESIKCSLEKAEGIFDVYHNKLFPGITKYREEYVLKTAKKQGYVHLGLGCRMYTKDPEREIRTIANATVQFWSILTLIAINELNHRIREAGLEDRMDIISTIYDSVYIDVDKDPEIIEWLNKNLIDCMTVQYLEGEIVHNEAQGEVGKNFADLHKVKNNASAEEIAEVLNNL